MANTETPRPPLPFGTTSELDQDLTGVPTGTGQARQQTINQLRDLVGDDIKSELTLRGDLGATTQVASSAAGANQTANMPRNPFILTCQQWIEEERYIIAAVNPSEIQWRLPQRAAAQKTRVGEIVHYWRDRFRGTFFDEPQLSIQFQSGNIMPMRTKPLVRTGQRQQVVRTAKPLADGTRYEQEEVINVPIVGPDQEDVRVPPGLDNFYEFLQLVDEQKILDNGDINYVYIIYNSRIFPNITLAGLFTPEGVSWSDSAGEPNQLNGWSATFTVYDSYPRLNDKSGLVRVFEDAGWGRI
jgi:hypothetical protein